jgi:glycosyltransferase involved in cell wall biosynthesis
LPGLVRLWLSRIDTPVKISIALCTYNGERHLDQQLQSLATQTRLPDELIVCDDASTDRSVAVVEAFARTALFPVRLEVNQVNIGSARNFERAISRCAGEIIALCDQDDVWLPHKLAATEQMFDADSRVGLVFGDGLVANSDLSDAGIRLWDLTFPLSARRLFAEGNALEVLSRYNVITGATMAFRSRFRSIFLPIPEVESLLHDGWASLIIAAHAKVAMLPEPVIKYRRHVRQQVGLPGVQTYEAIMPRLDRILAALPPLRASLPERARHSDQKSDQTRDDEPRLDVELINRALLAHEEYLHDLRHHFAARRALPRSRPQRLAPVLREVRTGRYRRHSRAILSPLKDLLQ